MWDRFIRPLFVKWKCPLLSSNGTISSFVLNYSNSVILRAYVGMSSMLCPCLSVCLLYNKQVKCVFYPKRIALALNITLRGVQKLLNKINPCKAMAQVDMANILLKTLSTETASTYLGKDWRNYLVFLVFKTQNWKPASSYSLSGWYICFLNIAQSHCQHFGSA